jgi:hypothetical protein
LKPPSDQDWIAKYCGALIVCLVGIAASGYLRLTQPVSRSDIEVNQGLTCSHLCPAAPFAIIIAISVFWARRSILCPTL